jgi:prolyl-tRNA synthetase
VSTRLIGGAIMTHGDDSGLVLPPHVAPHQVVIVPIPRSTWKETVLPKAEAIAAELSARGVRVKLDATEENSPGWKFSEWELRGVPLRLEIGPKDIDKGQVFSARRDTREKAAIPFDGLADRVVALLEEIQQALLARARQFRDEHTTEASTWEEFREAMEGRPGFVIAPWCGSAECEAAIKAETQATLRNIPLGQPRVDAACIKCGRAAGVRPWFAKAY